MSSSSVLTMPWTPTPTDGLMTETLTSQLEVEQTISSILSEAMVDSTRQLELHKDHHLRFITGLLKRPLHPGFVALDASRPWLLYWTVHSLALFEGELDPVARGRVVETLRACQNPDGGFGGGPGQVSHLAPTYAAVSTLCYMGRQGWDVIDRRGVYNFFMSVKQPDGSFIMHKGGEVDVRGCYCALTVATLLNILTPELAANTSSFIASCQTYEGGLASSSHPFSDTFAAPLGEAHGGYAFCAVASWSMLQPLRQAAAVVSSKPRSESTTDTRELNLATLTRWATAMQANPIEGGGFRGRSNKLVDGCYSWWCGGLFGLLSSLLAEQQQQQRAPGSANDDDDELAWSDLYDRRALQEYVLLLAQAPHGGLRDKPGKGPDAYHTCYNLSGLSAAQHKFVHSATTVQKRAREWGDVEEAGAKIVDDVGQEDSSDQAVEMIVGEAESEEEARARVKSVWAHSLGWKQLDSVVVGGENNYVMATHPIFNLTVKHAEDMMAYFYRQG